VSVDQAVDFCRDVRVGEPLESIQLRFIVKYDCCQQPAIDPTADALADVLIAGVHGDVRTDPAGFYEAIVEAGWSGINSGNRAEIAITASASERLSRPFRAASST